MKFNRPPRFAIIFILVIFGFATVWTPPARADNALSEAISQARSRIQTELAPQVPGLDIAVAVDGRIVWSEGFGYADLAAKTPVTATTRFRIGSVSKTLTAAGLALLVERGQIDMDAPVQQYIPDFPKKDAPITLRLLAGHLSGIRNYHGREAFSDKPYPDLRSALKIFENDPLVAPPGTVFKYSSYNWNVLGVAMESAAKEDFLRYMAENVFLPLKLTNTVPDRAGVADPHRTQFYETDASGKFIIAPEVDSSYKWPSGGFLSTAEDLVRFGSAMSGPGFLKPQSLKLLFTSQSTTDGKPTHYGVGWFIGRTIRYHGGDSVGGTSLLLLVPASRTVVAIVSNRDGFIVHNEFGHTFITQNTSLDSEIMATALRVARTFAPLSPAG